MCLFVVIAYVQANPTPDVEVQSIENIEAENIETIENVPAVGIVEGSNTDETVRDKRHGEKYLNSERFEFLTNWSFSGYGGGEWLIELKLILWFHNARNTNNQMTGGIRLTIGIGGGKLFLNSLKKFMQWTIFKFNYQ